MGRPTKYSPSYCEEALEIIGRQGKSIIQFARILEVSRSTVYEWAEQHPEFSDILTQARDWSEAYWEDRFIEFMVDRNANAPLVKLYYANRFKWADKGEASPEDSPPAAPVQFTRAGEQCKSP
jgi:hypothetical protein